MLSKIRSVKPEFFRHYELFELETRHQMPIRIAFAGLWTVCDREGRFKWQPKQIKLDILPYDDVDIEEILAILVEEGFVEKYEVTGRWFGWVPTFKNHQKIRSDEAQSRLPPPPNQNPSRTRDESVTNPNGSRTTSKGSRNESQLALEIEENVEMSSATEQHLTTLETNNLENSTQIRYDVVTNQHRGTGTGTVLENTLSKPLNPLLADSNPDQTDSTQSSSVQTFQKIFPQHAVPAGENEGSVAPPPPNRGIGYTEESLQRHGNAPLRLYLFLDDSPIAKNILEALRGNSDRFLFPMDLWKRKDEFQAFVIEQFVRQLIEAGEDLSAGMVVKRYTFFVNQNWGMLERNFNQRAKDPNWFEQQFTTFQAVWQAWNPDEVKKFKVYYTTPLESGSARYQSNTFQMQTALDTWQSNNEVHSRRNSNTFKDNKQEKKPVIPKGAASMEDKLKHYTGKK